jgi:hypothetical protein
MRRTRSLLEEPSVSAEPRHGRATIAWPVDDGWHSVVAAEISRTRCWRDSGSVPANSIGRGGEWGLRWAPRASKAIARYARRASSLHGSTTPRGQPPRVALIGIHHHAATEQHLHAADPSRIPIHTRSLARTLNASSSAAAYVAKTGRQLTGDKKSVPRIRCRAAIDPSRIPRRSWSACRSSSAIVAAIGSSRFAASAPRGEKTGLKRCAPTAVIGNLHLLSSLYSCTAVYEVARRAAWKNSGRQLIPKFKGCPRIEVGGGGGGGSPFRS